MKNTVLSLTVLGMMFVVGCVEEQPVEKTSDTTGSSSESTATDSNYILAEEPDGAEGVIAVREAAKDGDEILITGRIGGELKPFVDGFVAFSIVDDSLKACSDIEGDLCQTPWDYCCETEKLPGAMTLVKFVDADGQLIEGSARDMLNVSELTTVVVKGKAQRDDAGNLVVLADSVYVKK